MVPLRWLRLLPNLLHEGRGVHRGLMFSFPLHPEGLGLDREKYRKRAFADQTDQKEMGDLADCPTIQRGDWMGKG